MRKERKGQRGQALVETALIAVVLTLLALLGITLIPLHRAHTAAISAAYACEQFVTQYPYDPGKAEQRAIEVARQTLGHWSALGGAHFRVFVETPAKAGSPGACTVDYTVRLIFDPLGLGAQHRTITLVGQSERWKASWH